MLKIRNLYQGQRSKREDEGQARNHGQGGLKAVGFEAERRGVLLEQDQTARTQDGEVYRTVASAKPDTRARQ
jgi:hypothetical protein